MTHDKSPAIVWCDRGFTTPSGKTAHGLVRHTRRYEVLCVIDAEVAGADAGEVLDGRRREIPIVEDVAAALRRFPQARRLVIGLAPDGGRLPASGREAVAVALRAGLSVDSGLHDLLTEDPALVALAAANGGTLTDVRRTPPRSELHSFTGRIDTVGSLRIAVLGTDSAVGKRTTAWMLVDALRGCGLTAELIGTGQTAWMQGARYGIVLDSLINDFVAGELEHACLRAWDEARPDVLVLEGQGSLLNPAYPGGFEILAACRPHAVVVQHAPARREYDGFPGHRLHPLPVQIDALELVGGRPVVAVTVNQEDLDPGAVHAVCAELQAECGRPTVAPLMDGVEVVVDAILARR
jgi:uncharacterized NAD-dependent epimerase/dehydratase family protein